MEKKIRPIHFEQKHVHPSSIALFIIFPFSTSNFLGGQQVNNKPYFASYREFYTIITEGLLHN
jgi:hypothetical protein